MCKWTDCGRGLVPPSHKLSVTSTTAHLLSSSAAWSEVHPPTSAARNKVLPPSEHFNFACEDHLLQLSKGHIPANTVCLTEWTQKVFQMWRGTKRMLAPEPSSNNLFEDDNPYQLTTHLSWLLYVEVRKTSGEFYPSTLRLSLCALLQHVRGINNGYFWTKRNHAVKICTECWIHTSTSCMQMDWCASEAYWDTNRRWRVGEWSHWCCHPKRSPKCCFLILWQGVLQVEHRSLKVSQLKWSTTPDQYHILWKCIQNLSFINLHVRGIRRNFERGVLFYLCARICLAMPTFIPFMAIVTINMVSGWPPVCIIWKSRW